MLHVIGVGNDAAMGMQALEVAAHKLAQHHRVERVEQKDQARVRGQVVFTSIGEQQGDVAPARTDAIGRCFAQQVC